MVKELNVTLTAPHSLAQRQVRISVKMAGSCYYHPFRGISRGTGNKRKADDLEVTRPLSSVMHQLPNTQLAPFPGPPVPALCREHTDPRAQRGTSRAEVARGLRHMLLEGLRRLSCEGRVGAAPRRELLEPPPRSQPDE